MACLCSTASSWMVFLLALLLAGMQQAEAAGDFQVLSFTPRRSSLAGATMCAPRKLSKATRAAALTGHSACPTLNHMLLRHRPVTILRSHTKHARAAQTCMHNRAASVPAHADSTHCAMLTCGAQHLVMWAS